MTYETGNIILLCEYGDKLIILCWNSYIYMIIPVLYMIYPVI